MKVAKNEHTVCFDVDDTLIMWEGTFLEKFEGCVEVVCPHDNKTTYHRPHKRHIEFLKKEHARGYTVVVWSSAGAAWAESVIKSLKLEEYVDFVLSKPQKWVDDLKNPAEILGVHLYLSEDGFSR